MVGFSSEKSGCQPRGSFPIAAARCPSGALSGLLCGSSREVESGPGWAESQLKQERTGCAHTPPKEKGKLKGTRSGNWK